MCSHGSKNGSLFYYFYTCGRRGFVGLACLLFPISVGCLLQQTSVSVPARSEHGMDAQEQQHLSCKLRDAGGRTHQALIIMRGNSSTIHDDFSSVHPATADCSAGCASRLVLAVHTYIIPGLHGSCMIYYVSVLFGSYTMIYDFICANRVSRGQ